MISLGDLDELGGIATALGLLGDDGEFEPDWLRRPGHYLGTVLAEDHQREALVEVVDELLGGAERHVDAAGRTWLPLLAESSPQLTVYLVVNDQPADHVQLGVGVEVGTADPASTSTLHLPLFRAAKAGHSVASPVLLGGADGRFQLGTDITMDADPPVPGQAHLGGIGLSVDVPTGPGGADPVIGLQLKGLQLPGAAAPRDLVVSAADVDELDDTVLELVFGLVQAQAAAVGGEQLAAVAGVLGLASGTGVPAFPVAELADTGVAALAAWFRDVVDDAASRAAWLAQLADAVGGAVAGEGVELAVGSTTVAIGVLVTSDAGGQPVVIPQVTVSVASGGDVRIRATADVARLDLGPGTATALPALSAFVELGRRADGTGTPLLTGDPQVEALAGRHHARRPAPPDLPARRRSGGDRRQRLRQPRPDRRRHPGRDGHHPAERRDRRPAGPAGPGR